MRRPRDHSVRWPRAHRARTAQSADPTHRVAGRFLCQRVIGRLTWGRVLASGAASGAWFGLFVGLLLSLVSQGGTSFGPILLGLGFGLVFGLIFAAVTYGLSRGRRDFQSVSQLVAGRYDVLCQPRNAEKARELLAKLAMSGGPA